MKNKLVFGLVLLFLISAALHAQEIKFDGYINSGLGFVYSSSAEQDDFLKAFGVDSEQNGFRFRLNGSYINEKENAGVKFRFQSQSRLDQGYFSLPYVYGWMRFLNNIFYTAAGIVDDTSWQTTDWFIIDDVGEGLGALIKVTPITGLEAGCGIYLISQQAAGSNNILSYGGFLPNFSNIIPKINDAKYVFSASYTMPDIFWLGASFRRKNKAGWKDTIDDIEKFGYFYEGRQESAQLIGEFRFLRVENLTAVAAVSLDRLEEFSARGEIIVSETFAYKLDKLTLGLNAAEFLYNRKNTLNKKVIYDPSILLNLWGSFAINNIAPRLDLVYFAGGRSRLGGNENYMWHRRAFINREVYDIGTANNRSPSLFSLRPSVKFNIASGTFIEIGDMFNYDFGNYDSAYGDSTDPQKRSLVSNVFYVDFKWSY